MSPVHNCRICGVKLSNYIECAEMMFGTREKFLYGSCPSCYCLQLVDPPDNIKKYYSDYYGRGKLDRDKVDYYLRKLRFSSEVNSYNWIGKLLNYFFESVDSRLLKKLPHKNSKILDVGCANGLLLCLMADLGYTNLEGCDPYIDEDISYNNGVKIRKTTVGDLQDRYDVIMLHHVLEHIDDQEEILKKIYSKLEVGGLLIVRIPTCTSYAFNEYQNFWYQIDAPRHFYLHSRQSISALLGKVGFESIKIEDDSTIWQFISSELYKKNIPFNEHMGYYLRRLPEWLISGKLSTMKRRTNLLNLAHQGDQICVVAQKLNNGVC